MKKILAVLMLVVPMALTACNNDLGNYVVGVPTVFPTFTKASGTYNPLTNQTTGAYQVSFKVAPGSPGGVVQAFTAADGTLLPLGVSVPSCSVMLGSVPRVDPCDGAASGDIGFSAPGSIETLRIKGIKVQGFNGLSKDIVWSGQIPLVPMNP